MGLRGDLGIQIPASQVYVAQKSIIARRNLAGKPAIWYTFITSGRKLAILVAALHGPTRQDAFRFDILVIWRRRRSEKHRVRLGRVGI
jgi:Pyruvate kinase, barrel domain